VHFDIAGDHKDYQHRSGRTGRAGATGVVVSLVTDADASKARQLQVALGLVAERPSDRQSRPAAPRHASRRPRQGQPARNGSRREAPASSHKRPAAARSGNAARGRRRGK